MTAVYNGHIPVVQLLLEHPGIDVNMTTENNDPNEGYGLTVLHLASGKNNVEALRLLLAHPTLTCLNARDSNGNTPLMAAVSYGSIHCVKLLLEKPGIDVNISTKDNSDGEPYGQTALHLAYVKDSLEILRLLLDHPTLACLNAKDSEGHTPLMWAVSYGGIQCVKELVSLPEVDLTSKDDEGMGLEDIARDAGQLEAWQVVREALKRREQEQK